MFSVVISLSFSFSAPPWMTHLPISPCWIACSCPVAAGLFFFSLSVVQVGLFKWPAFRFPSCTIPVLLSGFSGDFARSGFTFSSLLLRLPLPAFPLQELFTFSLNVSLSIFLFLSLDNVPQKIWILRTSLAKSCCCWHSVFHFSYNYVELNPWALRPSCF